jgi:hypothetical protein
MFTPLPGHTVLPIAFEQVVAVIESINTPNIAIPELGTEPTKAYLIGALTPGGGAALFCYLLQLETNRPILYISNPAEVPLDQYTWLETESIQYVESMGFMLDNLGFRARDPAEQQSLYDSLPPFREQLARAAGSTPMMSSAIAMSMPQDGPKPERVALARLLASF